MLVLTVKLNEKVIALLPNGDEIEVLVKRDHNGNLRLVFNAPNDVQIWRDKLYQKIINKTKV
jgi:carbon storage regulator CsrA